MKVRLLLKTEKALKTANDLKKQTSFREKAILKAFEKYVFREKRISEQEYTIECLNAIIGNRIGFPDNIREAYNRKGCEEGLDYELQELPYGE